MSNKDLLPIAMPTWSSFPMTWCGRSWTTTGLYRQSWRPGQRLSWPCNRWTSGCFAIASEPSVPTPSCIELNEKLQNPFSQASYSCTLWWPLAFRLMIIHFIFKKKKAPTLTQSRRGVRFVAEAGAEMLCGRIESGREGGEGAAKVAVR